MALGGATPTHIPRPRGKSTSPIRTINPIKMRNAQQSDETHSIKGHVEKKAIEIIIK